jgi:hypothetical protein
MTKLFILIVIFINYSVCFGQNLVPNPSFEDTVTCPFSANEVNAVLGWHTSRESPDYYNLCNTYTVGIPSNVAGFQYALDGEAYIGFIPYSRAASNAREHFTCQLLNPLENGTKYFVSFYLSHANNYVGLSCNKIGLFFSTVNYDLTNPSPINNQSQFFTDSIIQDTLNWVLVSGSFISDSNYTYMTVGGFFEDSSVDTIYHPPASHSYYLIDKICVSTDSLTCDQVLGNNEIHSNEHLLLPNPFTDYLYVKFKYDEELELILYDISSRVIFKRSFINSFQINTEQVSNGLYIYELRSKNTIIKTGKLVKG